MKANSMPALEGVAHRLIDVGGGHHDRDLPAPASR